MSLDFDLVAMVDLGGPEKHRFEVFSANCTHNVIPMWKLAGVYEALYESGGKAAETIIPALREGISIMMLRRPVFEALNPENGWGQYKSALPWLEEVLRACIAAPKAIIEVSR